MKKFGKRDLWEGMYAMYDKEGLDLRIVDGRVATIFFYYRAGDHSTFDGATDRGIGMWSTVAQVVRAYGKPTTVRDVILWYLPPGDGTRRGARDYQLDYDHLGIGFTFYDNELADIAAYQAVKKQGSKPPTPDTAPPTGKVPNLAPVHTILAGRGLRKSHLGMPAEDAMRPLGKPDKVDSDWRVYDKLGLDLYVTDGRVAAMVFYFRGNDHITFDGVTDKGMGMWSTIPQVQACYGKPTTVKDRVVGAEERMPEHARERILRYDKAGIAFAFYNNELGSITVYRPAGRPPALRAATYEEKAP